MLQTRMCIIIKLVCSDKILNDFLVDRDHKFYWINEDYQAMWVFSFIIINLIS